MGRRLKKRRASARPYVLIILLTAVFCVAQNWVPEPSSWFVRMETNAAILALGIFAVIAFRVRSVARVESLGAASQIDHANG